MCVRGPGEAGGRVECEVCATCRAHVFEFVFSTSVFTRLPSERVAYTCFLTRFTNNAAGFEPRTPYVSISASSVHV